VCFFPSASYLSSFCARVVFVCFSTPSPSPPSSFLFGVVLIYFFFFFGLLDHALFFPFLSLELLSRRLTVAKLAGEHARPTDTESHPQAQCRSTKVRKGRERARSRSCLRTTTELLAAVVTGDKTPVNDLIKKGANINFQNGARRLICPPCS